MTGTRTSSLTLRAALSGFVLLSALLFSIATVVVILDRAKVFQTRALTEALSIRGSHAAEDLARRLHDSWVTLAAVKAQAVLPDKATLGGALAVVVGDGSRVSWAGFAEVDGEVRAASNGLLLGQNVASRPWFQRGLLSDFAGDVHEAVLLNKLLGGTEADPLRFIDLAAPVTGPDGTITGVVGLHIDFAWAENHLTETADELGLDLFLLNQAGEIIIATDPTVDSETQLQVFRAAAAGVASTTIEIWPDEQEYHAAVITDVRYKDLPSFGWRMVARIPSTSFSVAQTELVLSVLDVLSVAAVILFAMTAAFGRWFLRPFHDLAENAYRIADGSDEYPYESDRTAEIDMLSAALARLQARRGGDGSPRHGAATVAAGPSREH